MNKAASGVSPVGSSSSNMKIKLVFGDTRIVVPVAKDSDKVSNLILDINKRLQSYLGDSTIRIKELTTGDGFVINPNDVISSVIGDSWILSGSDYQAWAAEQWGLCITEWYTMSRQDHTDNSYVTIRVGKHKHNKIFIAFGGYMLKTVTRLELFDVADLESFGKGGKPLIAREQTKDKKTGADRFVEAAFVVEGGKVTAVELVAKMTSDFRPQIERVAFTTDPLEPVGDTPATAAKVIQSSRKPRPAKPPALPASQKCAKTLDQITGQKTVVKGSDHKEVEQKKDAVGTGTSKLQLKQKDGAQADQGWWKDELGGFEQFVYNHITFFNKTTNPVFITKVSAEHQLSDGSWKPAHSISLGTKSGNWRYNWGGYDPEGFKFPAESTEDIAVRLSLVVPFYMYEARGRRIHHSLPNPIKVRINVEDADGGKSSITTEYVNNPIEVENKEYRQNYVGKDKELTFYAFADDQNSEERITAWAYHEDSERWGPSDTLASSIGSSKCFYMEDWQKLEFEALQQKKEEMLIDEISKTLEKAGNSVQYYALTDVKEGYLYGIKCVLKTRTTTAVESFYITVPQK